MRLSQRLVSKRARQAADHSEVDKGTDNGNKGTDNGNKGTDNGNKGTDNGGKGIGKRARQAADHSEVDKGRPVRHTRAVQSKTRGT